MSKTKKTRALEVVFELITFASIQKIQENTQQFQTSLRHPTGQLPSGVLGRICQGGD